MEMDLLVRELRIFWKIIKIVYNHFKQTKRGGGDKMARVSVIIPLYNVEMYARKSIDSVLNQSLEDIEIILVNDGSPDNCGEIAEEYKKKDSRVKVIHKDNGGLSSARNAGLELATSEYILFVDSDDWIEKNMIEDMITQATLNRVDLVVCNYSKVYKDKIDGNVLEINEEIIDISEISLEQYFFRYIFSNAIGDEVCNKLYRKSIIIENDISFEKNNEIFAEDKLFNLGKL